MGTVAMSRPPTVALSADHADADGQHASPGRQRQLSPRDTTAADVEGTTARTATAAVIFILGVVGGAKRGFCPRHLDSDQVRRPRNPGLRGPRSNSWRGGRADRSTIVRRPTDRLYAAPFIAEAK
jgi:hypothetical protein